ncbi:MAG TPA: coproporphyrinogen-III oxidase family protein [Candidatus Limnocylindrales bacterium]
MAGHRVTLTPPDAASAVPAAPVALYVHIPFCVGLCPYCDFVVVAGAAARGPRNRIASFLAALHAELGLRADALDRRWGPPGERPVLGSVYLGGGTPSLIPPSGVRELLDLVRDRFGLADDAEVTLEANPGRDERGDPELLRRAGVTRLSIGAQSLQDAELRRLGRRHRAADVVEAVAEARAAGIASIGLDLLYDVPEQTQASWIETLDAALDLAPDHLSLYALTLDDPDAEGLTGPLGDHLPTTAGARRWRRLAAAEQDEDRAAAEYHHATVRLSEAGYRGYEISNWARPGHESRHNLVYWRRAAYEAVGPGAHAFDGVTRRWNAARLDGYLDALWPADGGQPRLPPGGDEAIHGATERVERTILGLRLDDGLPLTAATEWPLAGEFGWALAAELVTVTPEDRIVLTTRGRLLSNELFSRLIDVDTVAGSGPVR